MIVKTFAEIDINGGLNTSMFSYFINGTQFNSYKVENNIVSFYFGNKYNTYKKVASGHVYDTIRVICYPINKEFELFNEI